MKKRIFALGLFALLGLFSLLSCEDEEHQEKRRAMIHEAFEKRIATYRKDHARKCRREVMEFAKLIVDSTMLARARNIKVVDSLSRPPKPGKPSPPPPKILEDTLEVAPLLPLDTIDFFLEN